jgi:DNA-binding CsgD family transcriptional regulator
VIADACAMGTLPASRAASPTASPTAADRLVGAPGDASRAPGNVVVRGPGGTGKTRLLGELASAYRRAGLTVVHAGDGDEPNFVVGDGGLAVLVDDAHHLTGETADRVRRLLELPRCSLAVAFRPWPRPPALLGLVEALAGDRRPIMLAHADRATVATLVRKELGEAAPDELVDAVLRRTGGLPALVHPLLRSLGAGRLPSGPAGLTIPDDVLDVVRGALGDLDDGTRMLLHALAAGAPLENDVLADLLETFPEETAGLVAHARASGLLLPEGTVIPLVGSVLLAATPPDVTRSVRRRTLGLLLDRGEEPLELARSLAADQVRDPRAARLLERHGNAALTADPTLARELLGDAAATGAPDAGLAARRAHAAALAGDFDAALRWADSVLTDDGAPDRSRAAAVAAVVMAHRGLMARSAELFRLAGPERAGSAALALIGTGSAAEASAVLGAAGGAPGAGSATILAGTEELMARGILQSLGSGTYAESGIAAALSTLTGAATLLEPVGRTALVLDTPAALAALVALHSGELDMAESVLERAVAADVGGAPTRPRHLLLLAWIAMMRGRLTQARDRLGRASTAARGALEPRDGLFLQALEVGLARRSSDVPALGTAWARAREALLRQPIDLFTLLPLGELMIAGARLKDSERLHPQVAEAEAVLARLGDPQLWSTPLHWSGAQAAILADDPAALRPHAAALVAAARTSPYAAVLARAGRSWMLVLTGDIDAPAVEKAAMELASVGLVWDAARLAGQAAVRAVDPRARTSLLSCARALGEGHGVDAGATAPAGPSDSTDAPSGCRLSEREREVARLVVAGQTYREIGGRLYISAKTVEHHVSRMRQRLGASSRSDLLDRLRAELAQGA